MLCRIIATTTVVMSVGCNGPQPDGQASAPTAAAPASAPSVSGKAPAGAIITLEPSADREFPLPDGPE